MAISTNSRGGEVGTPPPPAHRVPIPIKCGICPSTNIVATETGWKCGACLFECIFVQRHQAARALVATSKSSQRQIIDYPMRTPPRSSPAKGQSKSAVPASSDVRRLPVGRPPEPPGPPPIRPSTRLASESNRVRPRWRFEGVDTKHRPEWQDFREEDQERLHDAHNRLVDHGGPAIIELTWAKSTWEINFETMTQMNVKTRNVRAITCQAIEPFDPSYHSAGPARRSVTPAWSEGTVPTTTPVYAGKAWGGPCMHWICVQDKEQPGAKSYQCGKPCRLRHEHYDWCNCQGHQEVQIWEMSRRATTHPPCGSTGAAA